MSVALRFEQVSVSFPPRNRSEASWRAVANTTLSVDEGEFVSVVGPTGCGKSTLLNVAAGLLAPSSGEVRVFGEPLMSLNRHAGYMFQADALLPWKTTAENIGLGLMLAGVPARETAEQTRHWLAKVGLTHAAERYPHQLSGGMKKRVGMAQALIVNPKILLMDEPFSALDVQTRQLMENELLALWQNDRKSVLFITHDLEEAISLSDRVIVLSAGPDTHPIGEFLIDLQRPRDVAEIRLTPRFVELHEHIWRVLRGEVLKGYAQTVS
ncbi:MAG: ABC transporter ATP-binding protein [Proteobacteria bacterium]|nr:ABC transporter ATP-binding protein [Pseudomonadota bacterium]